MEYQCVVVYTIVKIQTPEEESVIAVERHRGSCLGSLALFVKRFAFYALSFFCFYLAELYLGRVDSSELISDEGANENERNVFLNLTDK